MSTLLKAKRLFVSYMHATIHPPAASFSGAGEDRVAIGWINCLSDLDWPDVRYLDVGACHPTRLSNTFALYSRGAKGLLVEPNPDMRAALERRRPRDKVVSAGVAFDGQRSAELHRFSDPVFNSFGDRTSPHADYIGSVIVPLIPLNDILQEHFPNRAPDFLSIDTEGADFAILKSIDFNRHKPLVICIETSSGWDEYDRHLSPFGYQHICRTPDNAMFVLLDS